MTIQLNSTNIGKLDTRIQVPRYDRQAVSQSIMHVGVGGFHRAHQAVYTDDLLNQGGDPSWGYCGVGLLKHDARMHEVMQTQDCLYTVVERSSQGNTARVIGSIGDFVYAPDNPEKVIEQMASPNTRIVSMTITEGGYYFDSNGELDTQHADLQRDLANPHTPSCSFGYLLEALDRRRQRGLQPFTIMSCDNIQGNGSVAKKMLSAYAELRDPTLRNWMDANCLFPNSMVDRITPATTDELRAIVQDEFGIEDAWPVMTEPFKQWVIEDHFVQGRPQWEDVGAQMTEDVLPYELMKLRLLNGTHQALCYIGLLLGKELVHETMEDADIRTLCWKMMDDEATPTLSPVPGIDLADYKNSVIERFANPAIRDQLSRISIYGSAGLPSFVLPSITAQLKRGGSIKMLSFVIASWFRFLNGQDDSGKAMPMLDPMADALRERVKAAGTDARPLLAMREVFSESLANEPVFVETVSTILKSFYEKGAEVTLKDCIR
ncbi:MULTISPECIES: mannitol dehydrogenase family protein [unclassified Lentimonas]|uniref:mannitol dehydrogenase family protein n=1 Tax=unclassified Lentimonas TaxID=2630993 RepID=UPI00132BA5E3|nr:MULTISPECIES: mannitol dehydrogenase family protein [unclassified Lentimonas]CAA6679878.1 Multiple polyol-specific dehydrogenase (EC [Lentimonas sp. CC4]CAA6685608.1 Multiple polyol-specific dehydrogenase (EC [Lentimonas sp. CC6]CAA6689647.1 Multiple polyol-specific dehydrogenase (EC [Lentimonas sp. CC19]CAA6692647.1 Multiple polyol-specific dehydrogenase (EC [Lentimonas sp. CC10]CAA7069237.1 Multiple polyol-specific dehydrogenase (EC [Lentimonas sp. CC11]